MLYCIASEKMNAREVIPFYAFYPYSYVVWLLLRMFSLRQTMS